MHCFVWHISLISLSRLQSSSLTSREDYDSLYSLIGDTMMSSRLFFDLDYSLILTGADTGRGQGGSLRARLSARNGIPRNSNK